MTSSDKFDDHLSGWLSSLDEPWNRLRYAIGRLQNRLSFFTEAAAFLAVAEVFGFTCYPIFTESPAVVHFLPHLS